jgi:transcriptional antiterminator
MNENELKEVNELLSSGKVEILSEGGQGEVIEEEDGKAQDEL